MNLSEAFDHLQPVLNGDMILPGDPQYMESRSIWNDRLRNRPSLVIRAVKPEDVAMR